MRETSITSCKEQSVDECAKRGEEEGSNRVDLVQMNTGRFVTEGQQKSEREGLKDGRETCYDVRFGGGGTNKKTGDRAGTGGPEDVKSFIGTKQTRLEISISEGQYMLRGLERKIQSQSLDGLDMCRGQWTYWTKHVEDRAARQEKKRKTTNLVCGYPEGGHEEGCCHRGGCQGYGEIEWKMKD